MYSVSLVMNSMGSSFNRDLILQARMVDMRCPIPACLLEGSVAGLGEGWAVEDWAAASAWLVSSNQKSLLHCKPGTKCGAIFSASRLLEG